ncbi:MAG: transcriptional repressor LexA [Deltaproteobacteria bacterium]|nr:transcriptional repressor LexA [Deltaproteobacteria bacterium]
MTDADITPRQREIYEFIQDRIRVWGYPPTIREIGEHLGIRSTNGVADHLKALKRKGYLTHNERKSRALTPVQQAGAGVVRAIGSRGEGIAVPILGRVAAGEPILAEEQATGSVVVDSVLLGDGRKVFALKVVGDSMIEDGIHDGDYIFVRKREVAERGEVVVVIIEGEATVKRYYPEGDRIRLQPANSRLKPIYVHKKHFKNVQIIGVVVGVYRKM